MQSTSWTGARYAVLFRTHFWDAFAERQYRRLRDAAPHGDLFVLVDETAGPVPVSVPDVVRHTTQAVLDLGLAKAGHGNVLWFNGDYPLYFFFEAHPAYDYYVMAEYDVVALADLDVMVAALRRAATDFVGLTKGEPVAAWALARTCAGIYPPNEIAKRLICLAAFSNRAVAHLLHRKRALSRQHTAGEIVSWPYCEAFIPTELARAGFRLQELSAFGSTDLYDWKPAIAETDLGGLAGPAFLHPVLDPARYVSHTMRDVWPPEIVFAPRSEARRRLRRVTVRVYGPPLARALWRRVVGAARRCLALLPGRSS